ncbi:MAG TPA: autotransporter-associated beta strand repeat-containing protein [Planctomycetota bacterium]|nr:autotransporter-associated beta strand repeat-containing protein [Planctomycetota bacterium]
MALTDPSATGASALTLALSGGVIEVRDITWTRALAWSAGTLRGVGANARINGTATIAAAASVAYEAPGAGDVLRVGDTTGDIAGGSGATIQVTGAGTVTSEVSATYSGRWVIDGPILDLGHATGLGSNVATDAVRLVSGTLKLRPAGSVANGIRLEGGTVGAASGNRTLSGPVTIAGDTTVVLHDLNTATPRTITLSGSLAGAGTLRVACSDPAFATWVALQGSDGGFTGEIVIGAGGNARLLVATLLANASVVVGAGGRFTSAIAHAHLDGLDVRAGGEWYLSADNALASGAVPPSLAVAGRMTLGAHIGADYAGIRLADGAEVGAAAGYIWASPLEVLGTVRLAGTFTCSGVISGTGGLDKVGVGTVLLSGVNTYAGDTDVSAGRLTANSTSALGATAAGTSVASGATLNANPSGGGDFYEPLAIAGDGDTGVGALILNASVVTWRGAVALTADASVSGAGFSTNAIYGIVSGPHGLTKRGTGGMTLYGANTYTGLTTVLTGSLALAANGALGDPAAGTIVSAGAILTLDTVTIADEALSIAGSINMRSGTSTWSGPVTLTGDILVYGNANLVVSGGMEGAFGITKQGAGDVILSGANSFTGPVQIDAGTVTATTPTALGTTAAVTSVASGARLRVAGAVTIAEPLRIAGVGPSTVGALWCTTGPATWSGAIEMMADAAIGCEALTSLTISGVVSGAYQLRKVRPGEVVLASANTYGGSTLVSGGKLTLSHSGALGAVPGVSVASVACLHLNSVAVAGSLALAGETHVDGSLNATGSSQWTGSVDLTAASTVRGSGALVLSGDVSGAGRLATAITGGLTLSGNNTYSGETWILSGGTLTVASATALGATGSGTRAEDGGTLVLAGVAVAEPLALIGAGVAGRGALVGTGTASCSADVALESTGAVISIESGETTLTGVVSGAALTKQGAAPLALAGANTWTGALRIDAGSLRVGTGAAIPDGCAVTFDDVAGAELDLDDGTETIGSLAGGGPAGGDVALGAGELTVGADDTSSTYAGALGGTGILRKIGAGTLTLSGASPLAGTLAIDAGGLAADGNLASAAVTLTDGMLSGSGTVGEIDAVGGTIRPGSAALVGQLQAAALRTAGASGVTIAIRVQSTIAYDAIALGAGALDLASSDDRLEIDWGDPLGPVTIGGVVTFTGLAIGPFERVQTANLRARQVLIVVDQRPGTLDLDLRHRVGGAGGGLPVF